MFGRNRCGWCFKVGAGILLLAATAAFTPAMAGDNARGPQHACFANDSIVMGKRLAPRPGVVQARLNSPACRDATTTDQSADEAAIRGQLDRIDENLSNLYRAEIEPATPMSAN